MELNDEQAQDYFTHFNFASCEIEDAELDNVSGGGCTASVSDTCPKCGDTKMKRMIIPNKGSAFVCATCEEFIAWDC